mgnify:FL=1
MATTITSTQLDFETIKSKLKIFLKQDATFSDYDFEGSALNNILDILAYNTHFSGLIANFALNESYLGTAQLRNSVVSLAESLGYIPGSKNSSQKTVNLTINLSGVPNLDPSYSLLPGELKAKGSINDIDYTFTNRKTISAEARSTGIYQFSPFDDKESSIILYEGEEKTQKYLVDTIENAVYVIPDQSIDTSTAIVKVYEDGAAYAANSLFTGSYSSYNNIFNATSITSLSRLYVLRESPNGFYELTFGAFNSLGISPVPGNIVEINYLRTNGISANGISNLEPIGDITLGELTVPIKVAPSNITLSGTQENIKSSGGTDKEEIESIRKKAPFQYASQNRMVTPVDYEAMILRTYGNLIEDIVCWGGQDNVPPEYGTTFTSIIWKENLSSTAINDARRSITDLTKELSVVSFNLKFLAPSETYISTFVNYQFNPLLGSATQSAVDAEVQSSIIKYFTNNIGRFQQVFRRSNLLTLVDEVDTSVLSSRADIRLQKRIIPIISLPQNWNISFSAALKEPNDIDGPVVRSALFEILQPRKNGAEGLEGVIVYIRNKLNDNINISSESSRKRLKDAERKLADIRDLARGRNTNTDSMTQSENIGKAVEEYFDLEQDLSTELKVAQSLVFQKEPSNKLEIVNQKGEVLAGLDNIGYYTPATGDVSIINLNISDTKNSNNYIKIFAVPANESAIVPKFSNILKYDASESSVVAVTVDSRV